MIAYDFPLLSLFWTMLIFFFWFAWILLVFRTIGDIFRNSEMGGVSGTQRTAAETLQKYLEKASGVRLPIVSASEAPETGTLVLVGRRERRK